MDEGFVLLVLVFPRKAVQGHVTCHWGFSGPRQGAHSIQLGGVPPPVLHLLPRRA